MLSNRKILFVEEKGLFKKSYNLSADIPYEDVKGISSEGRYVLKVEVGERSYNFISQINVRMIERSLQELIESAKRE